MRLFIVFGFLCILANCKQASPPESRVDLPIDSAKQISTAKSPIEDFDAIVKKFEDPERVNWQNPEMVFSKMGNLSGKTVADIGTGSGYFAFRLIRKGASVICIDIEPKFLDYIEERKSEMTGELKDRIITRLAKENDPELLHREVDFVLIVNTYFFLSERDLYLLKIKNGLKPGGKLIVVDYKPGNLPVGPSDSMKVSSLDASKEMSLQGFKINEIDTKSLQFQYIIIAER